MAVSETSEWRLYAGKLGFSKTEYAEKDYLQELMLYWLFNGKMSGTLVFRGGTAISKLYGSGRFSEDIDLVMSESAEENAVTRAMDSAIKGMKLQYATEARKERYRNMLKYVLKIQGPLYAVSNSPQAVQTIQLDINLFERPLMHVKEAFRRPIYPDIAPYLLNSLEAEELLADKIKALVERIEPVARDLYDAWLLSTKYELKPDLELVGKKMQLYGRKSGEQFSLEVLKERIASIKVVWDSEIGRLLRDPPSYDEVAKGFLEKL